MNGAYTNDPAQDCTAVTEPTATNDNAIESAAKNVSAFLFSRLLLAIRECPDARKWSSKKVPAELGKGDQTLMQYIKAPLNELDDALMNEYNRRLTK